jgi:hypothetical protein
MGAATSLHRDKMIMRCIHDEITRPLDASDIDTPRGETAKHEVHRLRGLIGSRALGEEAAVELKVAFDEYDTDGSGEVGVEELGRIIKKLGLKRSKQQVQAMVDKVDADGSGEVDFVEYCALLGVTIRGPDDLKDIECCYDKPYGTVMFSEKENRFFYLEGDIDDLAGPEMIALMGGSKRRQMELKAQRKKDSGALIMWISVFGYNLQRYV